MSRPSGASRWLAAAAALLLHPALARAEDPVVYRVGIIPQAPPVTMVEKWGPLLARLSALTGATLRPKVYDSMEAFEQDLFAGGPEFVYAHPAMVAAVHRRQGYLPLVRDRRELAGQIFVRTDSPYRSVSELQGKRVAFVGERSFCTILVDRALAEGIGRMAFDRSFHGSTRNVLRSVVLGKVEAGASLDSALELEDAESSGLIRPLLTSASFAPHPIAAHPRVPAALREKVASAVLEMARDEGDRPLLAAVRMPDPLRADYDRDYKPLEPR
ncbi:MAG: phosphate/phosphite/phosphonate ABC transporter substrate-binding protein [Deltaproteobacteria bacterium]|nr:phosphate/phosphite/phosphonate ABC transporter substrate-binding protein [Deltaproteobacteria bacterium]